MGLSEKAQKIAKMKYFRVGEEWENLCWRVADYVSKAEAKDKQLIFATEFYQLIYNKIFIPGGRILANAGTDIKNLMNCFVLDIQDSRDSIYNTLKDAAEIFAWGGGIGFSFSNVREEGADIKTTGGKASGPLSFMSLFDQTGEVISQASRRGAQMGILDIDHPDIEKFINYKSTPNSRNKRLMEEYLRNLHLANLDRNGKKYFKVLEKTLQDDQLSHFNISVMVNDDFMQRAEKDDPWSLISRRGGITKTLKAKELLAQIANMAWESGDPGVLFKNRINEDNMVPYLGELKATNPCVTGDTEILTAYEGAKPIKDLVGYDTLVYTWNPETKLPEVSVMTNVRKTGENVQLLEVEFDTGLKVRCTPNHNFYSFRGNKIQAKNLKVGQSIRAFSGGVHSGDGHIRAHGWVNGKAKHKYTARMVWEFFFGEIEDSNLILHHKDLDKLNNDIQNLMLLTNSEHSQLHHRAGRRYRNHKIVSVLNCVERDDVYNGVVLNTHAYIIADKNSNPLSFSGIVSANCGEIPLLPGESCNLGAINLHSVYNRNTNSIDFELLEKAVRLGIRFLDDVQTISTTPVEYVNKMCQGLRRLGLGIMGWADFLAEMEIPYDSEEAIKLGEYLSWFISFFSWLESINLAEEKGTFPFYDKEKVNLNVIEKVLHSKFNSYKFNMEEIRERGVRNVSVTTVAPTGTIALLCDVNSGIEPFFALAYKRNITEGVGNIEKDHVIEINPILFEKLKKYEIPEDDIEEIKQHILKFGNLSECPKIPEKLKCIFRTSMEISPYKHVDQQAAWQSSITNAVSKTINCPEETTKEEIENIFQYAWNNNLKGVTLYRNRSKTFQILNIGVEET